MNLNKFQFLVLFFLVLYSLLAIVYNQNVPPKGDEIHYLVMVKSLISDHDLALENNYPEFSSFYPNLDPHTVTGTNNHQYSLHDPGLPILILPFFILGGRVGVSIMMSFIGALLIGQIFLFSQKLSNSPSISFWASFALGFSLPFIQYSFLIFGELVGALFILIIFQNILQKEKLNYRLIVMATFLPWLHIRLLPLSFIFAGFWLIKYNQCKNLRFLLGGVLALISIVGFFLLLNSFYGSFNPSQRYNEFEINLGSGNILANFVNIFIDRQYGLLPHSPFFLFAIPGVFIWFKKNFQSLFLVLVFTMIYLFPILRFHEWSGGYNPPPTRYIIPILPLWIPAIIFFFCKRRELFYKTLAIFLVFWGVLVFGVGIYLPPNHGFVYKDGVAPDIFFISQKIGLDVHRFFPAYYPLQKLRLLHFLWILVIFIFCFKTLSQKSSSKLLIRPRV